MAKDCNMGEWRNTPPLWQRTLTFVSKSLILLISPLFRIGWEAVEVKVELLRCCWQVQGRYWRSHGRMKRERE